MKINDQISALEKRLEHLRELQRNCNHVWEEESVYDPEKKEIIEGRSVYQGSDWWIDPVHTGRYETIDRWSRTCKKCGLKEYTYDADIVEVKKKPRFGK